MTLFLLSDGFPECNMLLYGVGGKKGGKKGSVNGKKDEESDIFKLVKMIMQRNFDPVSSTLLQEVISKVSALCQHSCSANYHGQLSLLLHHQERWMRR